MVRFLGVSALLAAAVACGNKAEESGQLDPVVGPVLAHVAPPGPFVSGLDVQLAATANDPDGVSVVRLFYRPDDSSSWSSVDLVANGESWIGEVPGAHVEAPGFSYYFEALDNSPYLGTSYLPLGNEQDPFHLEVSVQGETLPWIETWEDAESDGTLYDLGWTEHSDGFPGYPWDLTSSSANTGNWAITHGGGIADIDPIADWLITPALDLSSAEELQVRWYERGDNVERAQKNAHQLYISLGSPDPGDGDFQPVMTLPIPQEDVFARTSVIDLSGWSGNRVAYLAWRYQGMEGDTWTLDDIEVRALAPDLELVNYGWSDLSPGGEGVLTLDIANRTRIVAPGVVLTVTPDDPAIASYTSPVAVGDIDGDAQISVDVPLVVDPSHPDNAYVRTTVEATDGSDIWVWELLPVVGERSLGEVSVQTDVLGYLVATVGTGDPDHPEFEVPIAADILDPGSYTWSFDVTDAFALLPPGPGPDRWWLALDSTSPGQLTSFTLSYDGQSYDSDDLGAFVGEEATVFYLPRPPEPSVTGVRSDPDPVEPGDAVDLVVDLLNVGHETVGVTTATLSTSDSDVLIASPDPVEIASAGWMSGSTVSVDWSVVVSDEHRNSRPVSVDVTVTDEVESVETSFDVAVPWPVLDVSSTTVDDDGDRDDLLDAGETAELEIELTNVGLITTFGVVRCELAITGGSADAVVLQSSGTFGLLDPNEAEDENDFVIEALAGADGDDIQLQLDCTDDRTSYEVPLEVVLGVPPWQWISSTPDAYGDTSNLYPFDLVNGEYRCDGTTLDIVLESAVPYDIDIAFIEAWGSSNGSEYEYFQLVAQAGLGFLRGYNAGVFTTLSNPTVTQLDDYRLMISVDTTNMGLVVDSVDLGFASGFCADTYYCDHFPDGWGDPYQAGFVTSLWFPLSW